MTTFGDRVYELGGVPVGGGSYSQAHPTFGNEYFVDVTNGSDSNSGKTPTAAKASIQAMLTYQIANNTLLGDIIWVFPGVYIEEITGVMTKVQIIGLTCGGVTEPAKILPADSYGYTGDMNDSAWRNIMFLSPYVSNKELPCVLITYGGWSVIDNCNFVAQNADAVTGLQLGVEADNSTTNKFDFSHITNNTFAGFYGVEFQYGIKHSNVSTVNNPTKKQMWNSVIANNQIMAEITGIHLGCGAGKIDGSVITKNKIHSMSSDNGCSTAGIRSLVGQHSCFVTENNIVAADGIVNFGANTTQNNYVAVSGTVSTELPALT